MGDRYAGQDYQERRQVASRVVPFWPRESGRTSRREHEEHEEATQQQQETQVQVLRRGRVRLIALGHGHLLYRPGCH
jgi:hypothetical protein